MVTPKPGIFGPSDHMHAYPTYSREFAEIVSLLLQIQRGITLVLFGIGLCLGVGIVGLFIR